jgi:hypothetical protein
MLSTPLKKEKHYNEEYNVIGNGMAIGVSTKNYTAKVPCPSNRLGCVACRNVKGASFMQHLMFSNRSCLPQETGKCRRVTKNASLLYVT